MFIERYYHAPPPLSHDLATRISGRVVTHTDLDWDSARQVFNLTTDLRPAAIVLPSDVDDVIAAVQYAAANGRTSRPSPPATTPRLWGRSRTSSSSTSGTPRHRHRRRPRLVRVGSGVRWQDVISQLSDLGLAALHGSSPLVGIAGYSLGGGMGWLARKHGLQTNSVKALELVTADGRFRASMLSMSPTCSGRCAVATATSGS